MLQSIHLDIKQETVDDQNEAFRIKAECILQWDDSLSDVKIKDKNDHSKTCTFTTDDQNETFLKQKEYILQWDESSSILQWDKVTGCCQIKQEHNGKTCEYVVDYKTELESGDSHEGKLSVGNSKFNNCEGNEDNNRYMY